ncbi:MAG TPA: 8-amino-7-oxononanoate synthase [Candidatus Omnitrophota bacterium]|nr:8-amino-7-oxononanoate synthase [Candidatus Omnitrophota bacterium]
MKLQTFIQDTLDELEQQGLKRQMRLVKGGQGRRIMIDGKEALNFCSNNYLGLADDERLQRAAIASMKEEGFGAGASRLVCGNMGSHRLLEKKLAAMKGTEDCLVFSTGYMANVGIIASLFGREDIIFSDRLNHASIIDGILLSQAEFKRYPHRDMEALEAMLKEAAGYKKKAIITDSVFSMDGDIAPLDIIVRLAKKHDCLVMVDEAHAFGVMGEKGKGLAEHFGVERSIDIQMGTLSKAAGSFGAYCCGSKELISYFINKARSFIYTTGMPPSVAAASLKAVEIIEAEPELRSKLWMNTNYIREGLQKLGFDTMNSETPIIPVLIKDTALTVQFSETLLEEGIFISAIRPPTVPANGARLRLTVTSKHTQADLDDFLMKCQKIGKELCLI